MSTKIAELLQARELMAAEYLQKQAALDELIKIAKERKHTPIVSRQQQKLFGAVASGSKKLPGLSKREAEEHLRESKGKDLPKRAALALQAMAALGITKKADIDPGLLRGLGTGVGATAGALASFPLGQWYNEKVQIPETLKWYNPFSLQDAVEKAKRNMYISQLLGAGLGGTTGYLLSGLLGD